MPTFYGPPSDGSIIPHELEDAIAADLTDTSRPIGAAGHAAFARKIPEDALRWWRAQVGGATTAPADVLVVSDSTGEGAGAGERRHRWVDRLLAALRREYQPDGVAGGEGYTPAAYSGGTISTPWSYSKSPVILSDEFNRTGDINGMMPDVGPVAWGGGTGQFVLDGSAAVGQRPNSTAFLKTQTTEDRELSTDWHLGPTTTTNQYFILGPYYADSQNSLELRGVLSQTTSEWAVRAYVAGSVVTFATFATPPVPVGAGGVDVSASVKLDGLTVTATVNGQSVSGDVTAEQKAAFLGINTKVAVPGSGSKLYNYRLTSLAEESATPALRSDRGLGNRAIFMGSNQSVTTMTRTFTGTGVDVIVQRQAGFGALDITVDGDTSTHETAGEVDDGYVYPVRGLTSGEHTLTLSATGADVVLEGVFIYNGDESAGIRMWEGARSGAKASSFSGTSRWHLSLDGLVTPDLLIVGLGLNDYAQATPPEDFRTNMRTIINRVLAVSPDVSVVLHNSYQRGDVGAPAYPWADYVAVIDDLAAEYGGVVVDLNARMLGYDLVPAALQSMWVGDKVHPSPQGHGVMKDAIYSTVKP